MCAEPFDVFEPIYHVRILCTKPFDACSLMEYYILYGSESLDACEPIYLILYIVRFLDGGDDGLAP